MDITKYHSISRQINAEIERFNALLAKFKFSMLDASSPGSCLVVANNPWKSLNLGLCPSGDCPGVYVLCACQKDNPTSLAAYVGKASGQNISREVGQKLGSSPQRAEGIYTMSGRSGQTFIIEVVVAVGVREAPMRFLASALEEFIIDGVQGRINLLNGTGVER